ncbi:MAG: hypothetical protein HYR73_04360 [Candidatus Eisenbacteria bacterium]|nr:hypothetical protein [Candidatus Eisenbacteria bacterium]
MLTRAMDPAPAGARMAVSFSIALLLVLGRPPVATGAASAAPADSAVASSAPPGAASDSSLDAAADAAPGATSIGSNARLRGIEAQRWSLIATGVPIGAGLVGIGASPSQAAGPWVTTLILGTVLGPSAGCWRASCFKRASVGIAIRSGTLLAGALTGGYVYAATNMEETNYTGQSIGMLLFSLGATVTLVLAVGDIVNAPR